MDLPRVAWSARPGTGAGCPWNDQVKTRIDQLQPSPWQIQGWRLALRFGISFAVVAGVFGMTVYTAVLAKESRAALPLAAIETVSVQAVERPAAPTEEKAGARNLPENSSIRATESTPEAAAQPRIYPAGTRFFDGRPVRAVKTIEMTVTAYSPDWRSCGDSADGITATLHHVSTNGAKLVAADPRLLPYGSMLSIPGYDAGQVVPVLDCGGAIKGNRLDVLFPTHEEARKWGVRKLKVTVWDYADGMPRGNPRAKR